MNISTLIFSTPISPNLQRVKTLLPVSEGLGGHQFVRLESWNVFEDLEIRKIPPAEFWRQKCANGIC